MASGLDLERPYRELGDPLESEDARKASHITAQMRRRAEEELERRYREAATKEADYRRELSKVIVKKKADHGATIAKELAADDEKVRELFIAWKVADGLVEAGKQRLKGLEGERSMLKSLIDWSATIMNVLRQSGGAQSEPERRS
jgi:hypothetical protein